MGHILGRVPALGLSILVTQLYGRAAAAGPPGGGGRALNLSELRNYLLGKNNREKLCWTRQLILYCGWPHQNCVKKVLYLLRNHHIARELSGIRKYPDGMSAILINCVASRGLSLCTSANYLIETNRMFRNINSITIRAFELLKCRFATLSKSEKDGIVCIRITHTIIEELLA